MKIKRGYKTELAPNAEQRKLFLKCCGVARFAYNWALNRRREVLRETGKSTNAIESHRELNSLKAAEYPWMYEVSKTIPQEALRHVDRAFDNFFRRLKLKKEGKHKGKVGFPCFKSKKRGLGSFTVWGAIHVRKDRIKLPRIGWVKLKEKSYIPDDGAKILSATISEKAGRWFVSVNVEKEAPEPERATGEAVGADLGVRKLATCSNGNTFENPRALRTQQRKIARFQRKFARRQKGSNRKEVMRKKLARARMKEANIRKDAIHKATSAITAKTKPSSERPYIIGIEDLNVSGMLKNRRRARSIQEAGLGEFRRQLTYKKDWYGNRLYVADMFYPSSKTCSRCGWYNPDLQDDDYVFVCDKCHLVIDRDLNASINLKKLAVSSTESINGRGGNISPLDGEAAPVGSVNRGME